MPSAEDSSFATANRARLAAAARHLVDAILTVEDATEDELARAASATEDAVRGLLGGDVDFDARPSRTRTHRERRPRDYVVRSPLVGVLSPLAPPLTYEFRDGGVVAHGSFGAAFEGPPGCVHGGCIALAFDEALGMANAANGSPGMTGRLTIRYRRPTPLHTDVRLEATTDRVDGRRIMSAATLRVGDQLTAEAQGLFVRPPGR